jgi:hypothetical protein
MVDEIQEARLKIFLIHENMSIWNKETIDRKLYEIDELLSNFLERNKKEE